MLSFFRGSKDPEEPEPEEESSLEIDQPEDEEVVDKPPEGDARYEDNEVDGYDFSVKLSLEPFMDAVNQNYTVADLTEDWIINIRGVENRLVNSHNGVVLGVIGEYNKGKTKFLSLLCGAHLGPIGNHVATEGLSFKFTKEITGQAGWDENSRFLVVDTAGVNSPLNLKPARHARGTDKLKEVIDRAKIQDHFYRDIVLTLCAYPFLVVNDLTCRDIEMIQQICEVRKAYRADGHPLIVVHNLKTVTNGKELIKAWEGIRNAFCEDDRVGNCTMEQIASGTTFLALKNDTASAVKARHVVMVNDHTEWGKKYNRQTILKLRTWMEALQTDSEGLGWSGFKLLEEAVGSVLKATVVGCEGVRLEPSEDGKTARIIPIVQEGAVTGIKFNGATFEGFAGKTRDNSEYPLEWKSFTGMIDGKKFIVFDLKLSGVDDTNQNSLDFSVETESGVKKLVVRGRVQHNPRPFENVDEYKSSFLCGQFQRGFTLPTDADLSTINYETTEDRIYRVTIEIKPQGPLKAPSRQKKTASASSSPPRAAQQSQPSRPPSATTAPVKAAAAADAL